MGLLNFNDALLAKLSWRIVQSPSCVLVRILLGKYCRTSSFLDCSVTAASSHGWRGICTGKDLIKSQLGKVIGSGLDTLVWNEPWLSLSTSSTPMGPNKTRDYSVKTGYHAADALSHQGTQLEEPPLDFN